MFLTGKEDDQRDSKYISPNVYDVMLTDVNITDIKEYCRLFGFVYNSKSDAPSLIFPVNGIVADGTHGRVFIPMIVHYKKSYVRTLFLVDTGSPYVYLTRDTFDVIGITDAFTVGVNLFVHGKSAVAFLSTKHFSDINVIGASYFTKHSLHLSVRYDISKVTLNTTEALTRAVWEEL